MKELMWSIKVTFHVGLIPAISTDSLIFVCERLNQSFTFDPL